MIAITVWQMTSPPQIHDFHRSTWPLFPSFAHPRFLTFTQFAISPSHSQLPFPISTAVHLSWTHFFSRLGGSSPSAFVLTSSFPFTNILYDYLLLSRTSNEIAADSLGKVSACRWSSARVILSPFVRTICNFVGIGHGFVGCEYKHSGPRH